LRRFSAGRIGGKDALMYGARHGLTFGRLMQGSVQAALGFIQTTGRGRAVIHQPRLIRLGERSRGTPQTDHCLVGAYA